MRERDEAARAAIYRQIQEEFLGTAPFVVFAQQQVQVAMRSNLTATSPARPAFRPSTGSRTSADVAARTLRATSGFALQVALTLLGLLAVTFFIGRVVPIDPVLAVVGDQAPRDVYEAVRAELGLDRPLPVQFASTCRMSLPAISASPSSRTVRSSRTSPASSLQRWNSRPSPRSSGSCSACRWALRGPSGRIGGRTSWCA
jgi:hypothetical protein